MPVQEFFTLDSENDGLQLSAMCIRPEGEPRVLVQLAHGMTDHKERYAPLMQYLAERGCFCAINDHRGHGASVRTPEDLGYFYPGKDVALVQDMHQLTRWMRAQYPGKKLILLGHSMGSLAARAYCADYDGDIDGLILCGSPGRNPLALPVLALTRLLAAVKGDRYRSARLWNKSVGIFARRFPDPDHPCAWVSLSQKNVLAYEADPLCTFSFTMNGFQALMNLMRRAYGLKNGRADLPVRFYSGAEDPCAPNEKGFQDAINRMRKAGYTDAQGTLFPNLRHEILNEDNQQEIFERIWTEAIEAYI